MDVDNLVTEIYESETNWNNADRTSNQCCKTWGEIKDEVMKVGIEQTIKDMEDEE